MIVVDCKNSVGVDDLRAAQHLFQHDGMGVIAHDPGKLDNEWRASPDRTAKQSMDLLEVTHIESTQCVLPISGTEQLDGSQAHMNFAEKLTGACSMVNT